MVDVLTLFLFLNKNTKMIPVVLRLQKGMGVSLQFLMASNGLISTIVSGLETPVHFYQVYTGGILHLAYTAHTHVLTCGFSGLPLCGCAKWVLCRLP